MRKEIAVLLAATMCLGIGAPVYAAPNSPTASKVKIVADEKNPVVTDKSGNTLNTYTAEDGKTFSGDDLAKQVSVWADGSAEVAKAIKDMSLGNISDDMIIHTTDNQYMGKEVKVYSLIESFLRDISKKSNPSDPIEKQMDTLREAFITKMDSYKGMEDPSVKDRMNEVLSNAGLGSIDEYAIVESDILSGNDLAKMIAKDPEAMLNATLQIKNSLKNEDPVLCYIVSDTDPLDDQVMIAETSKDKNGNSLVTMKDIQKTGSLTVIAKKDASGS